MSSELFETSRKPILDEVVSRLNTTEFDSPSEAYGMYLELEETRQLPAPTLYVSTSITSGGHVRDPQADKTTPEGRRKIIEANNLTAALLIGQMVADNDYMDRDNIVLTTEMGYIKDWTDSDYMQFWSYILGGVDVDDAEGIDDVFLDAGWEETLKAMNTRGVDNELRWPPYKRFTSALAEEVVDAQTIRDPMEYVLQLVDVQMSLGCRAETILADELDAALLAPEIKRDALPADQALSQRIGQLIGWGAKIGLEPAAARLAVVNLD